MKTVSLFILVAVMPIVAFAQPQGSLIGTWELISYEDTPDKGPPEFPWGKHPSGILIYDNTGHMAVQIQRMPIDSSVAKTESKLTTSDKVRLLGSYTAYFGTYSVDWQRMTINHHVIGNLFPLYIGTDQEKGFELADDRFTLKTTWTADGKHWSGIRIFERTKPLNDH